MFRTLATWVEANCPTGAVQENVLEAARRAERGRRVSAADWQHRGWCQIRRPTARTGPLLYDTALPRI